MEAAHASKYLELESALSEVAAANDRADEALMEAQSLRQALDEFKHGKIVEVSPNGKNRKIYAAKATIELRGSGHSGDDDDDDDDEEGRNTPNQGHQYHHHDSNTSSSSLTTSAAAASNALLQATRAALGAAEERAEIATREASLAQAAIVEAEGIAADAVMHLSIHLSTYKLE